MSDLRSAATRSICQSQRERQAALPLQLGRWCLHYQNFEGGYTVGFETFTEDVDMTPRLKGLPDDLCQAPHWGTSSEERFTYKTGDREEVIEGGEAFYVPPRHTLVTDAGTEFVFFSPTREWQQTLEKIGKNPRETPARTPSHRSSHPPRLRTQFGQGMSA